MVLYSKESGQPLKDLKKGDQLARKIGSAFDNLPDLRFSGGLVYLVK